MALLVSLAASSIFINLPAQAQRDCGNPDGTSFKGAFGSTTDNLLICGSNNNLAGLATSIAVGISNTVNSPVASSTPANHAVGSNNTIQNMNTQSAAVGDSNTINGVNAQNHAFGSNNTIGNPSNQGTDKGNNNTALGSENIAGTVGTASGTGSFPNAARNNNTAVGYQIKLMVQPEQLAVITLPWACRTKLKGNVVQQWALQTKH